MAAIIWEPAGSAQRVWPSHQFILQSNPGAASLEAPSGARGARRRRREALVSLDDEHSFRRGPLARLLHLFSARDASEKSLWELIHALSARKRQQREYRRQRAYTPQQLATFVSTEK